MNILMISNMYPNKKYPSYGVFVKNFEEMLKENEEYKIDKVVITKTKNKFKKIIKYVFFNIIVILKVLFKKYDVIYIHYVSNTSFPVILMSKFKKLNIYANVHGTDIIPQTRRQEKMQRYVLKVLNISNKVIVPSSYFKEIIYKKYNFNEKNIYVFPSAGINEKVFRKVKEVKRIKNKYGFNENDKICGYISRINEKKGWNILIDAIEILNKKDIIGEMKFIFVGDGEQKELLRERIDKLEKKANIIILSAQTQDDLAEIYNMIDFFCFPTFQESLGLVALEALACGTPVICSDIEPLTEYVINDYNGYLFEVGKADDLVNKIEKFMNLSCYERKLLEENSIKASEQYKRKNIKKTLMNIL